MKTWIQHRNVQMAILLILPLAFMLIRAGGGLESTPTLKKMPKLQRVAGRFAQEFLMTHDPRTNTVPKERLLYAFEVAEAKRAQRAGDAIPIYWEERGPNNVGGRTRGLIIDANDPTGRTVWAGGVAGGLWRTNDIDAGTPSWTNIDDFFDNLAISTLAQDPSNPNFMYFGTGENGFGNADAVRGLGIWRSIDGGANWAQLPSTLGFTIVNKIVIDNAGVVYAGTNTGIRRSMDNGMTWPAFPGAPVGNIQDLEFAANGDLYAGGNGNGVFRFQGGTWTTVGGGLPTTGFGRVELACAPGNANVLYAAFEDVTQTNNTNPCLTIMQTTDGGANWTATTVPGLGSFCWYAFILAVDPNDANRVWAGDQNLFVSDDAGANWTGIGGVHADHHAIVYLPGSSDEMVFGNDGGVYRCTNASAAVPTLTPKNNSYNVTQFYANAIDPTAGSNYFLGGTQDNGTQRFTMPGLGSTDEPTGADGAFCFIDQDNPMIQITGSQNRHFNISTNGGGSFSTLIGSKTGTLFITPADYDDANDAFYFSDGPDTLGRITDVGGANTTTFETITAFNNSRIATVKVSPNTANRLFVGTTAGRFLRIDNADQSGSVTVTTLTSPVGGFISSISVEVGDDNHLLVTCSNFGVNQVLESTDGGTTWTPQDGDLPDMPVRGAMFSPFDSDQVLLATELGVWSCANINGAATTWFPTNNFGLANVRVDMLQYRASDHLVVAATHGRGMYSTDYFTLLGICPDNLAVNGPVADGIYVAKEFVTSTGTVANGGKVIFHAGVGVDLLPDFTAERGSDFWALILGCDFDDPFRPDDDPVVQTSLEEQEESETNANIRPPNAEPAADDLITLSCYPNPSRKQATVQFTLPREGIVHLSVMDVNGKLVHRLAAGEYYNAGIHFVTLHADLLQSGFYFIVLRSGSVARTEKVFVVR